MSFWTFCKLLAALLVMAIMGATGILGYHVFVAPMGGLMAKWVPTPMRVTPGQVNPEPMLEATEMPDIDPGEKAYQKAHELLAMGQLPAAREKLMAIVNVFPGSATAPVARRIVGEMNLDELLSPTFMTGKSLHGVKRGESLLAIATRYKTNVDCIMALNSMTELRGIQPGDELVVMPLELRVVIELRRKCLSLWDSGRFVCEYPIHDYGAAVTTPTQTAIAAKVAVSAGKKLQTPGPAYRSAEKIIQLAKPAVQIRGWDRKDERPTTGAICLDPADMEELNVLTRVGNPVEFR